jgi:uncharacterized tellurite resistance protein B-like protein
MSASLRSSIERANAHFARELFEFFDAVQEAFLDWFPNPKQPVQLQADRDQTGPMDVFVREEGRRRKEWTIRVLEQALDVCLSEQYNPDSAPAPIRFRHVVAEQILHRILTILSERGSFTFSGLMFLNDVRQALGFNIKEVNLAIEQVQYERRREFASRLLQELEDSQCQWVALMLWKAIHADRKVDYREYKYFENIQQLVRYDQRRIHYLEVDTSKPVTAPNPPIYEELVQEVFRYIIEIVLVDEEFAPEEADFIHEVGELLGYSEQERDDVIQPAVQSLMIRQSLFS